MLCNMKSPSSYMQAAFRAQNPCVLTVDGQRLRKDTAYVFDFDPARTLMVYDEFANNLLRIHNVCDNSFLNSGVEKGYFSNVNKALRNFLISSS